MVISLHEVRLSWDVPKVFLSTLVANIQVSYIQDQVSSLVCLPFVLKLNSRRIAYTLSIQAIS